VGLQIRNLTAQEAFRGYEGVVVTGVVPNSPASSKILPGDLVLGINDKRVSETASFTAHLAASLPSRQTTLHVARDGNVLKIDFPQLASDK
jgi:S1-C subfamily serine protease